MDIGIKNQIERWRRFVSGNFKFVKNKEEYWEFIRQLRTHEQVQSGFIEQVEITSEQQQSYMKKYGDCFYICLCDGDPAGYIGEIDNDIRVATHPDFQRMGVGLFMVKELMKLRPDSYAKVKIENEASFKLFQKAGFKPKYYILEKEK